MPRKIIDQYTSLYTPEKRYKLRHPEHFQTEDYKQRRNISNKKYRIKNPVYMKERKIQHRIKQLIGKEVCK